MRRLMRNCGAAAALSVALSSASPLPATTPSTHQMVSSTLQQRRWASNTTDDFDDLQQELHEVASSDDASSSMAGVGTGPSQPSVMADAPDALVQLEPMRVPPAKFDMLSNAAVYKWQTTAGHARKVTGPMREWCDEIKYRTGVHIEAEPRYPEKVGSKPAYSSADDVEMDVYFFGADRAVQQCVHLVEAALKQEPCYVRLGVFRRVPNSTGVEWLCLRRINRDLRPPDIPPISLKTPGKWTLMYEDPKEAAIRTLWEETGIRVKPETVFASGFIDDVHPSYFWRVPVRYFVAEVPHDVHVTGPHSASTQYMQGWSPQLLKQSADPIDRVWANKADPVTGCAWLPSKVIDELQEPLKGKYYMSVRYSPPPVSDLQGVVDLPPIDENTPGLRPPKQPLE